MSESSDIDNIISDEMSPSSSRYNSNTHQEAKSLTLEKCSRNVKNINDTSTSSTYEPPNSLILDVSLTDSDHSILEVPKILNASSPSSICSTRPLEWDSGADVGYDITSKQRSQDMSTIERIAVSSLVYNANSTPIDYEKKINITKKSNSLINLNGTKSTKNTKSASFEALQCLGVKSDTLPKCRSPMNSSLSVSTVVHKLESSSYACNKRSNDKHINKIFQQQEKMFEALNINSNNEQKSSESSKESNSTLGSADTAGSWVAREFRDSTNTTTDRVNSFEYLPGNEYYNSREGELEDYSDKEIKQSTKMLVEVMKQNGLTNEVQRKEIFKEIVESFLKNYVHKNNGSSMKSGSDSDQTPARQDFTSQTSNTANTIVNNQMNNQSSTITFTSPITSSRYGDDVDSKYYESSMDSGRHLDLQKCKLKQILIPTKKQINQSVQCAINDNLTNVDTNENLKPSSSNISRKNKLDLKSHSKNNTQQSKTNYNNIHEEFKKQMIWFHTNYMKTEKENQMLWINSQISHLNNLKKLLNTHEELKKNWNSYKQKQVTNNKSKFRKSLLPVSSSSSDFTTTTTSKTDSTISSKQFSSISRRDDTDLESSTTVCNHVHYKKGILNDEPRSMKKCCEKTLNNFEGKQKPVLKLISTCSQTEPIDNIKHNTVDQKIKTVSTFSNKSSISYDIIFKPTSRQTKVNDSVDNIKKQSISVACQTNKIPFNPKSSLQEYLMANRPDYVDRAEERRNILNDLASLRDERKQLKRNLLVSNDCKNKVPPNPLAIKRVMSQKEMRKQTERKYRKCPEVTSKKIEIKRKQEYRTNKIMANIFNKKLQKKTLKGKVDLSNSVSVCSL